MKRSVLLGFSLLLAACGGPDEPTTPSNPGPKPVASADAGVVTPADTGNDAYLYLEDVNGEKGLAFARAHDEKSEKELTSAPGFKDLEAKLFSIFSSKERIPAPRLVGDTVRNFWTDADHPRGLWRQTSLADYKKAKPNWTTILDIDALGKEKNESYVFHGAECLPPARKKCLVKLSRGGGDAEVIREFDVEKKAFVAGGFEVPEAKSLVRWKDENTIYVGTDFGAGTVTESGYPRISKEWKRGTPLAQAKTIFEGQSSDVAVECSRVFAHEPKRDICERSLDFYHTDLHVLVKDAYVKVDKPGDADASLWDDELLLRLRSAYTVKDKTFAKGALLAAPLDAFMKGERTLQAIFEPNAHSSLDSFVGTKSRIYVNTLADVKNRVLVLSRKAGDKSDKRWSAVPVDEKVNSVSVDAYDEFNSDQAWVYLEDFTQPATLDLFDPATKKQESLKQSPSFFDAKNVQVNQYFATSKDGTKVPYFEVSKKDRNGAVPTLLTAYGGFEVSLTPYYSGAAGAAWVERGGVFVQANIRGGGEYGPAWHDAALKRNRQNAYDDMAAVAEDLVKRGVTTSKKLGISGGSNGGLLTSVMLTQRPELFGAVVSHVPLTDMQRYHKLLAGASWMGEYGNPEDPGDWAALQKFSPLHNIKRGMAYPPMFFTSSTKDDRVHPSHARKMVAKLEAFGYAPLYYENIEGGHGGAADIKQQAYNDALSYTFLATRLGLTAAPGQPAAR